MFEDEEEDQIPSWAQPVASQQTEGLPTWATPVGPVTGPTEAVQGLPEWAQPVTQEASVAPVAESGYTPSELLEPSRLAVVDKFLGTYYGTSEVDKYTPQERVDNFVNTWRYLMAGNTIKTVGFVDHVLSTDDLGRQAVAEGYDLFEGLSGDWGDYSGKENLDRVRDYVVGAVLDPVNIIAPLVGKVVGQTGTTATSRFALEMARKEAARLGSLGASEAVQTAAANKVKGEALRRANARVGKAQAYKEVMGAAAFDMATAAGTDLAYQHGLIQSGAKQEQDRIQTGLAALGGLVGGGIAATGVALRGASKLPMANVAVKELSVRESADLQGVLKELSDSLDSLPENKFVEVFGDKVNRGMELEATDSQFWGKLLTGDDEVDFKGLGQIMYEKGFRYLGAREEGDNFTNWLADAFKNSPDTDVLDFVKVFQDKTGITLKDMEVPQINQLADNMARKMSDSGFALGAMGRVAKMLKFKNAKDITPEDYYSYLFGDVVGESLEKPTKGIMERVAGDVGKGIGWAQDSYIRLLVTHPGTSALNIAGWSTKTVGQSASDLLRATAIYGGPTLYNSILGRKEKASTNWGLLSGAYKANVQKVRNLLDPYTTKEAFDSLVDKNPEMFKDLVGVLPGGITRPVARDLGIDDPNQPIYQKIGEKGINTLQTLGLVKAQDIFTKSQEMMYNLDIALRESFKGQGYSELILRPDAQAIMSTKQWQAAQNKAIDRTLENILSKSYARHDNQAISRVAGFIEDFRQIPIVGATIPFGRFFNNVIATTSEYSGINIVLRGAGLGVAKNRDWAEVVAKPLVGWTAAISILDKEKELLNRGIAWDESVDESTGQRFSERFDAPAIGTKALARWLAYMSEGKEVPEEFLNDAGKAVLGQLTRQLSTTGDAFLESVLAVLQGESEEAAMSLFESLSSVGGTLGSGVTRFAEPVNALIALSDTPQEYMSVDVKTGNPGFAKAFRYIDQMVGGDLSGETLSAVSPTAEYVGRQPGRLAGQRPQGPTTAASRVFAMVGRPQWDADLFADDAVARNIVTKEFQPIFEVFAEKLLNNPVFKEGDLDLKNSMLSEALKTARNVTHKSLESSTNPDNPRLSILFKLTQQTSVTNLEGYIKELGLEAESLSDLTTEQLKTLKFFVDNDAEMKRKDAYRQLRNQ